MSIDIENPNQNKPGNGKMLVGLLLLILGISFLFQQLDFFFIPNWLFSWPSWLIIWGLWIGAKNNFRNSSWLIMVLIGLVFISDDIFPGHRMHNLIWPLAIIGFGIWLITKRNKSFGQDKWGQKWDDKWSKKYGTNPFEPVITPVTPVEPTIGETTNTTAGSSSTNIPPVGGPTGHSQFRGDDYLDAVSIFGGVKKIILSKDFKGGEIVNVFGGAELDFTQANIQGRVVIDITQIFGGTKIIVPSNWQVVSDLAAVFASVDDKRINRGALDNDKILVLKGVSIFAGVDVRSY
ncbi:LiaF transmembrane domain-containing protein [Mucilaginibacter sp.]